MKALVKLSEDNIISINIAVITSKILHALHKFGSSRN